MKKILILTIGLFIFLVGCSAEPEVKIPPLGAVYQKEYIVGEERVIVGGEKQFGATTISNFSPEIKLEKWGDETYIRVWSEEAGDSFATEVDGKVVWHNTDKSKEYNFYPLTLEDGTEAFEFEVILKEKPKTNVITLNIESKGLRFLYQPSLHPDHPTWAIDEETGGRDERPENVVGSYAVYHETQDKTLKTKEEKEKYKVGKAFHIYRPQMIDSNGWKVWGELLIENGIMSVNITQDFIDKAVYPIKHATGATFGYATIGSSNFGTTALYTYPFTSGGVGTLTDIYGYAKADSESTNGFHLLIYDDSNRIDYSSTEWNTITNTYIKYDSAVAIGASIVNQIYHLGFFIDNRFDETFAYDNDVSDNPEFEVTAYSYPPPATWSPTTSGSNRKFSIVATFDEGGGAATYSNAELRIKGGEIQILKDGIKETIK